MPKKEKVFVDRGKLLQALSGTDSDCPIKAPDLEKMIGISENQSNHNRALRLAISELIQGGVLIGSNNKGFFRITTLVELCSYINFLEKHKQGTQDKIDWIKSAWRMTNPNKPILKLKED